MSEIAEIIRQTAIEQANKKKKELAYQIATEMIDRFRYQVQLLQFEIQLNKNRGLDQNAAIPENLENEIYIVETEDGCDIILPDYLMFEADGFERTMVDQCFNNAKTQVDARMRMEAT